MMGKMRQAEKILHTVRNKGQLYDLRSSLDDAEEEEPSPGLYSLDWSPVTSGRAVPDVLIWTLWNLAAGVPGAV